MTLELRLQAPQAAFRHARDLVSFLLELHNAGAEPLELPAPEGWDADVPAALEHSSDSQGLVVVRRRGQPEAPNQRYTCSECEPVAPPPLRLRPGERHQLAVSCAPLHELEPGDYEVRVRLYQPPLDSNLVQFRVE